MLYDIYLPEVKTKEEKKNKGTFIIEPLYPGYGMTLGNSLRRVILSSLPGAAVTAVKIDGISHEFSTIPNIKEDMAEIVLNLKQLRVKVFSEREEYIYLNASGEKEVKAKDIKTSSQVEIINQDLHIATLDNKKAKLDMEIRVEQGQGYVPVEKREHEKLGVGLIAVDAIYTPVKKVRYNVESTRVGQMTNLDSLVIEIETDGTVLPKEALERASNILVDHFRVVSGEDLGKKFKEKEKKKEEDSAAKILIEEVNMSPRTTNALLNNDIKTIRDIINLGDEELKELRGFGNRAYVEVREKLDELGFSFNKKEKE